MTTISIDETDHEALRKLSEESGKSVNAVLHDLITRHKQIALLEATNAAYERLRQDPAAWDDLMEEQKLWDRAVADGLEGW